MGRVREGKGKEEGSDTFKALKTKGFTKSLSSSFLSLFDSLSGEKKEELAGFYIWGEWGKEKEKKRIADCEIYTILDALEVLYGDDSTSLRGFLYIGI